jgi:hypothetical protein
MFYIIISIIISYIKILFFSFVESLIFIESDFPPNLPVDMDEPMIISSPYSISESEREEMIKKKLSEKKDLEKCKMCDDEYCVVIKTSLKKKCVFCDIMCNNVICENKHIAKKCEKYLLYILENSEM